MPLFRPDVQGRGLNAFMPEIISRNLYFASNPKVVARALGEGSVDGEENSRPTINHARTSLTGKLNRMQPDGRHSSGEACKVRDNTGGNCSSTGRCGAPDHY